MRDVWDLLAFKPTDKFPRGFRIVSIPGVLTPFGFRVSESPYSWSTSVILN